MIEGEGENRGPVTDRTHGQLTSGATDDDIFRVAYPRMRRYAAVVAPPHIEPEDLLQDALAATLKKHRLIQRGPTGAFRACNGSSAGERTGVAVLRGSRGRGLP